jgi:hypothetical protein
VGEERAQMTAVGLHRWPAARGGNMSNCTPMCINPATVFVVTATPLWAFWFNLDARRSRTYLRTHAAAKFLELAEDICTTPIAKSRIARRVKLACNTLPGCGICSLHDPKINERAGG